MPDQKTPPVPYRDPNKLNSPLVDGDGNIIASAIGDIDASLCYYNSYAYSSGSQVCMTTQETAPYGVIYQCNNGSWEYIGQACTTNGDTEEKKDQP
jgi:hypothetical protein